jgi:hypothetical protein
MDYLLLDEEEFSKLGLGRKEQLLWNSVRRLDAGENSREVAITLVESGMITKNDLKQLKKWLKNRPKKTSLIKGLSRRGRL